MADTPEGAQPGGHLVIVGSSAGGIEALSVLVSTLPDDFPAPVVIAQHLDPHGVSHLPEILLRHTTLPVHELDQKEILHSAAIYVVPGNCHAEVTGDGVVLHGADQHQPIPSIDRLLMSAAEVYAERLVAVILTGSGSDGALGARDVKAAGGTVIVQNPESAAYPSMPRAVPPTVIDVVAEVSEIGPLLSRLVRGEGLPPEPEEHTLDDVLQDVRTHTGLDFGSYKAATISRRLQRRLAVTKTETIADYAHYLHEHPAEYQMLAASFLIKVTEFFRDPELFDFLRSHLLPELVNHARTHGQELRIWSAGCATGEEAYSVAMAIADVLGDELDQFNIRIFGTDLDPDAIAYARRGIYPAAEVSRLDSQWIERYFEALEGSYEVKKRLRLLTVFGHHDLGHRPPFPRIDLVLCRNVLMYFTAELQKRALELFAFSLRSGGYLILGKAETTTPAGGYFAPSNPELKAFMRHGGRVVLTPGPASFTPTPLPPSETTPVATIGPQRRADEHAGDEAVRPARLDRLMLSFPAGLAIVDRHYDLRFINSAARALLGVLGSAVGEDLIHQTEMVPTRDLRTAIDTAFEGHPTTVVLETTADIATATGHRFLQVSCRLIDANEPGESLVAIAIADVTNLVHGQLERLEAENRKLLEINDELANANLELRSAHEESMLRNEEALAGTEEVETLNEELQATNEELEALNQELQSANEELNTVNEDLRARGVEMQALATMLDEQRRMQSEFLAAARHDLNNPLTQLTEALERVVEKVESGADQGMRNDMHLALEQARHLGALVSELVNPNRLHAGHVRLSLERLDLSQLLRNVVSTMQPRTRMPRIRLDIDDQLARVALDADAVRLELVLITLLQYVISQATGEWVDIRLQLQEQRAEIQIRDHGRVLSQGELAGLFATPDGQPAHATGLGLTLHVARAIIVAHGGRLEVESKEGEGTTFTIRLPTASESSG